MTKFRVQIWEEMQQSTPSVDEQVVALTPRDAVVTLCKRERIVSADWVRVTVGGSSASLTFLDITLSPTGWFRYEAAY